MYTCEQGASNLVQDAIFKSSVIHYKTLHLNRIQEQHVLPKNILIAGYLSNSFFTTLKNAVFICCCWSFIAFIICCWLSCSCCFARYSCCLISRSAPAFSSKKSTSGSARLDLRHFGEAPPSSEVHFLVPLRLSVAFFLISSAVLLSFSCCFDAASA